MKATFANFKEEIVITIDLTMGAIDPNAERLNRVFLEKKLADWLETHHENIWERIEFLEGGSITISAEDIVFRGDNGIFLLERVTIQNIN